MTLHLNYATIRPYKLKRIEKGVKNKPQNKAKLKAEKRLGRIVLDEQTILGDIPKEAWEYKLGNRSALEWVLDQYREKIPKDPIIQEKFYTYCFKDYKKQVVDLLQRIVMISIETVRIIRAMEQGRKSV